MRRIATATLLATVVTAGAAQAQDQQAGPPAAQAGTPDGQPPAPATGGMGTAPIAGPGAPAPDARQPLWTVIPSITVGETATDNARSTPTQRQADLVTTITPGLFATGQSTRLQGAFNYSPTVIRNIKATDQDTVAQNLLANGTLSPVPDYLFLDVNASLSDQARAGARGFGNTTEITSSERTQQLAYGLSPYTRFHLGDMIDSEVRYRFSQANFSGNTGAFTSGITGQNLSALSNSTEQEGTATFSTASGLSRLSASATLDYDDATYSTSLLASRRASGELDTSYALTHVLSLLAGGGYERLIYSEEPFLNTVSPIWNAGVRYALSDKQSVTLTYGRRDGFNSFSGNALYALTPVTSVSAAYSESRSSTQQQILQNLQVATPTAGGTAINPATGLPFAINNPNLPLQNDIDHWRSLQVGLLNAVGRNQFSLIGTHVEETSLLKLTPSQRTSGGLFTWGHNLSEITNSTVLVGYSTTSPGTSHVITFSAGLTYNLGDKLQAGIQYQLYATREATTGNVLTNNLTLSLTKSF